MQPVHSRTILPATLAALGIVYGDIGTSPLYVFRACFVGDGRLVIHELNVLGVLSLKAVYTNSLNGEQVEGREAIVKEFEAILAEKKETRLIVDVQSIEFVSPSVAIERGIAKSMA